MAEKLGMAIVVPDFIIFRSERCGPDMRSRIEVERLSDEGNGVV